MYERELSNDVKKLPVPDISSTSGALNQSDDDFEISSGILVSYTGSATKVTVPKGVKYRGAEAFSGKTAITSVTLPEGIVSNLCEHWRI